MPDFGSALTAAQLGVGNAEKAISQYRNVVDEFGTAASIRDAIFRRPVSGSSADVILK